MCYKPLRIKNNSKDFNTAKDSVYNTVPCGHCGECYTNKQNEWKVRSFYEYLDTKQHGGHTLFVTFTYDEFWVPHFEVKGNKYRCFDKSHIQKFNKRIRHALEDYGYILPNKARDNNYTIEYKYIFTSEYGKRFTKRPHYHALLYFKGDISPNITRSIVSDNWYYGFLKFGDNQGVVYGDGACKYVTKYITKDLDFSETFDKVLESEDEEVLESFKNFKQFHFQSQGFGINALNYVSELSQLEGKMYVPHQDPKKCYIKTPLYLERKKFYKVIYRYADGFHDHIIPGTKVGVDCFPKYVLNEEGKKMQLVRYQLKHSKIVDKYEEVVNSYLCVEPGFLLYLNEYTKRDFTCIEDFQSLCRSLLGNRDLSDFVSYVSLFKDKVSDSDIENLDLLHDIEYDVINYRNYLPHVITNTELDIKDCDKLVCEHCYNKLPIFKDFDILNDLLTSYTFVQGLFRQKTFLNKYLELKQLKKDLCTLKPQK